MAPFPSHTPPIGAQKPSPPPANKAEAEINQYLRDGSGPIARFANADIRTWREHAKFGKGKKGEPRDFVHLQNGGELLAKIAASAPYDEKIRFLALLASAPSVRNSMGAYLNDNLALYEAIMEDDRNNAAFALAALAKISPTWTNNSNKPTATCASALALTLTTSAWTTTRTNRKSAPNSAISSSPSRCKTGANASPSPLPPKAKRATAATKSATPASGSANTN